MKRIGIEALKDMLRFTGPIFEREIRKSAPNVTYARATVITPGMPGYPDDTLAGKGLVVILDRMTGPGPDCQFTDKCEASAFLVATPLLCANGLELLVDQVLASCRNALNRMRVVTCFQVVPLADLLADSEADEPVLVGSS